MHLLKLMLREEYRLHVSYSSARMFVAIPVFVFAIAAVMGLTLTNIQGTLGLKDLITNLNGGVFLYGISVGTIGFMGRTYVERRQGKNNYIVAMPALLPMSYSTTFLGMFLRDVLFYLALMLGPAFLGLVTAAAVVHYTAAAVAAVCTTMVLSFMFGISLSFVISVIGSRDRNAFAVMVIAFLALLIGYGGFHLYGMEAILPSIGFQMSLPPFGNDPAMAAAFLALTVGAFVAFTALAVSCVAESYEGEIKKKAAQTVLLPSYTQRFSLARSYQAILAKEFVDLKRSGTVGKMVFTFIAPLSFLSFTTWYVNNGLNVPVGFNLVFYAAMVGFFGVMLYSWLTNMDVVDYYETLPVSVPKVIRAKLIMYLFLTTGISTAFVLMIAFLNDETRLLWLALPVLYVTSVYMVVSISHLTGLHPNSFLFNPDVLLKFSLVSLLPDICLTILSFSVDRDPVISIAAIIVVLGFLLAVTFLLLKRLDRKWSNTGFN